MDSFSREFRSYCRSLSNLFLLWSLQEHGKHIESTDYGKADWNFRVWRTQGSSCIHARLENEYGGEHSKRVSWIRTLTSLNQLSLGFLNPVSLVYLMVTEECLHPHTGKHVLICKMKWVSYLKDNWEAVFGWLIKCNSVVDLWYRIQRLMT